MACENCNKRFTCEQSPDFGLKNRELSTLQRAELLNIEIDHRDFEEAATACENFVSYFENKKPRDMSL